MTTSNRTWRWRLFLWLHVADLLRDSYLGLLGREPDPAGLEAYGAELARTSNLGELLTDIAHSDEFWEKIVAVRSPELVDAAFRGLLGREPDTEASASYAEVLTDKKDISVVLEDIVRSDEFWGKMLASRSTELVDSTFRTLLAREPDREAAAAYAAMLAGKKEISAVLEDIIGSDEFWKKMQARRSPELVDAAFRGLLGREPDTESAASYTEVLTEKKDISVVLEDIVRSDEFWKKMQARRSPELVDAAFRGLLGREPDTEAAAAYGAMLAEKRDISTLLEDITRSDEFWGKVLTSRSEELIRAIYGGLFGREPDPARLAIHVKQLKTSEDLGDLLRAVISSEDSANSRGMRDEQLVLATSHEEPCLVFLHIPKTAGTNLYKILGDSFGREKIFRHLQDGIIQDLSSEECSEYSIFYGHICHDDISNIKRKNLSVCTYVRKPKDRLLSLYYYYKAHEPSHPNYSGDWQIALANDLSVEEYFNDKKIRSEHQFWNNMTWVVMGNRQWRNWYSLLTVDADDRAIFDKLVTTIRPAIRKRLEEFMFVGLQEDFDRSIELLFHTFQKQPPAKIGYTHSLKELMGAEPHFKRKIEKQPVTPSLDSALDGLVQLDNIVYEEAKKLYTERMAGLQS